jgi:hypothetical protein
VRLKLRSGSSYSHEFVERQIRIRIGAERGVPTLRHDVGESLASGDRVAQNERVDEETDQLFSFERGAAGDREPDQDVVVIGISVKERGECGGQRHE